MIRIIGIDPGFAGAVAVVDGLRLEAVHDMPTVPVRWGQKTRNEVDCHGLYKLLAEASGMVDGTVVVLEDVTSSPQMGATSAFRFGQGYGAVQGVIAACGYRLELARPARWKKAMGLSRDKAASRAQAMRLWPDQADWFSRVKDEGRAEAALMAEWYRQTGSALPR